MHTVITVVPVSRLEVNDDVLVFTSGARVEPRTVDVVNAEDFPGGIYVQWSQDGTAAILHPDQLVLRV
jgi:hypothetical protein